MLSLNRVKRRFPEARALGGKNGTEFAVHCPKFHRKGGIYKLNINAESGSFYCQDCGFAGSAHKEWFDEIQDQFEYLAIERDEELNTMLSSRLSPSGNPVFARLGGEEWENGVPSPGKLVEWYSLPDDHPAVEYLANRGYDIDELRSLQPTMALKYCERGHTIGDGTTTGRIIFPIYMGGVLKGWQARKIDRQDSEQQRSIWDGKDWQKVEKNSSGKWQDHSIPKYLMPFGMQRSSVLYGYDQANSDTQSDNRLLVVVEGPLDQLKVGYPSVATLGSISQGQIRPIITYWNDVVIIRDPDVDPHTEKFNSVINALSPLRVCHFAMSNGKDPGSNTREQIWKEIVEHMHEHNREIPLYLQKN